ncbi:hypothetical protein ACMG4M_00395 [Alcanivorax sp. IL3]|jgi:hypothetical protein|uniref:hypothetical protein n=1 Tax=unclassified Alcanivorax TaxID=2638842 RepID=UPI0039C02845
MKAIARNWIIQEKIGLISNRDLVQLADNYIRDNDEFPDWMIDISTNGSLNRIEGLDLVLTPINDSDCSLIAQKMLDLFGAGERDIFQIATACQSMYLALDWGGAAFDHFVWISDELDLIELGVKPRDGYEENLKDALSRVIHL